MSKQHFKFEAQSKYTLEGVEIESQKTWIELNQVAF